MKRYKDIINICVINKKGEKIGKVEDLVFDIKKLKIYSYLIKDYSFFESLYIVPFKKISNYHINEIECEDNGMYKLKKQKSYESNFTLKNVINKNIIDTNNSNLGTLTDIIFDEYIGDIKAIVSSSGIFEDIFCGRRILITNEDITVNDKKIIVNSTCVSLYNDTFLKKYI